MKLSKHEALVVVKLATGFELAALQTGSTELLRDVEGLRCRAEDYLTDTEKDEDEKAEQGPKDAEEVASEEDVEEFTEQAEVAETQNQATEDVVKKGRTVFASDLIRLAVVTTKNPTQFIEFDTEEYNNQVFLTIDGELMYDVAYVMRSTRSLEITEDDGHTHVFNIPRFPRGGHWCETLPLNVVMEVVP